MAKRRTQNGKKMAEILNLAGPTGATIKKAGAWDLSIYIVDPEDVLEPEENTIWIEMCESTEVNGDLIFDPLMRIGLKKNQKGQIVRAIPEFYQSDSLSLGRMEINEKGEIFINRKLIETNPGELDKRLESWLASIDLIGYLREPHQVIVH